MSTFGFDPGLPRLLTLQVAVDVAAGLVIVLLLWWFHRRIVRLNQSLQKEDLLNLLRLIDESKRAGESFLNSLESGKESVAELLRTLEEKEARWKRSFPDETARGGERVAPVPADPREIGGAPSPKGDSPADRIPQVIRCATRGMSEGEIARRTGLTEGEVRLILDLDKVRRAMDE